MSGLNNQYIIAQEEHDYNKKYEKGSIVKHTIGDVTTAYTAKKNVPQFISILNENYWKKIASTNEGGTVDYDNLKNKPTINGVELDGNKTSQDLGVYSKPSSGIPQSDLSSDVQSKLNKHFKGWYNTLAELKAEHTATEGDSAYVKDASPATTWSIYVYDSTASSDNYWADSGTDADTTYVQTFASGEEVNEVHIVNNIYEGGEDDVLASEQGKMLFDKYVDSCCEKIDFSTITSAPMAISTDTKKWITSNNNNINLSQYRHYRLICKKGDTFIIKSNGVSNSAIAWLSSYNYTKGELAPFVTGTDLITLPIGKTIVITAPEGTKLLYIWSQYNSTNEDMAPIVWRVDEKIRNISQHPATIRRIESLSVTIDSSDETVGTIASAGSSNTLWCVPVKSGDRIEAKCSFSTSTARTIVFGFGSKLPSSGDTVTILNRISYYKSGTGVEFDDIYEFNSDGFFFAYRDYDNSYYSNLKFYYLNDKFTSMPFSTLRDEKIVVFGDSIFQFVNSFLKKGFAEYLADYTGAKVTKAAIGGTRIVPRGSGDYDALDIANLVEAWCTNTWTAVDAAVTNIANTTITSIVTNLKAVTPMDTTMIIIDGGGNDLNNGSLQFGQTTIFNNNSKTTLYGAINSIITNLLTANPYLKIFWCGNIPNFSGAVSQRDEQHWCDNITLSAGDASGLTPLEYSNKIKEQVERWKVPYIAMTFVGWNPLNFNRFFTTDNSHPYNGFDRMARRVVSQIQANYY